MRNSYFFYAVLSVFFVTPLNAIAKASSCDIDLGEPVTIVDGNDEVQSYENLQGAIELCLIAFERIDGAIKSTALEKITALQTKIASQKANLTKFKARLDTGSEAGTISKVDESIRNLDAAHAKLVAGRLQEIKTSIGRVGGLNIQFKSCLGSHALPSESTTAGSNIVWGSYEESIQFANHCVSPAGQKYYDEMSLQERLIAINDLQSFYDAVTQRLESLKKNKSAVDQRAQTNEKKTYDLAVTQLVQLKADIAPTLLAGQELWAADLIILTASNDCDKSLPIVDDPANTSQYLNQIDEYIATCKLAVEDALQNNNTQKLGKIRKNINTSIKNIDISSQTLYNFGKLQNGTNDNTGQIRANIFQFGSQTGERIDRLKELSGEDSELPIVANWRSEPFTQQFYAGLEATEVDNFSQNANAKIGLLAYLRPGKKLISAREIVRDCHEKNQTYCGVKLSFWPHWFFKADYSSAGEVSSKDGDGGDKVDTSITWESGFFWPLYYGAREGSNALGEINPLKYELMIGPIYSRGARKVSGDGFLNRYYRGIRAAFNEETYFDLLYGYSENVLGADGNMNKRWELRAQYPVSKFGLGRVFVGGNINFGHDDKGIPENKDSYSVYVMWQTSFDDLWVNSKKE